MKPMFFKTPADFRKWLEQHHATAAELLVGYYKKGSGKPSITWPESVDEALSLGWIDGVRKRIDDLSYTIRFTPRRPRSIWSKVNVDRIRELTKAGRMHPAGLKAFQESDEARTGVYSYEQQAVALAGEYQRSLEANAKAWAYFQARPPSYRKLAARWVMTAKKEETRLRRLAKLIECCANGRVIEPMARRPKAE